MSRKSLYLRALCVFALVLVNLASFAQQAKPSFLVLTIKGKGTIRIQLFEDKAPKTVARIKELTSKKFYDGQKFFKVVTKPRPFLAQFGDPLTKTKALTDESIGTGGTGSTVPFEDTGMPHVVGAVGLSRMPENPNSGDCQFYVMLGPAGFLDGKYCVFGQVIHESLPLLQKLDVGDVVVTARIDDK